jgi:RNA polymerase sigma-70 factor (ECF subfamily)
MELVAEIAERPAEGLEAPEGRAAEAEEKWLLPVGELPGASDDALVRAAVAGQREAFSELVRRYTNMVLWYVNARLRDPVESEEVTQETMVRAFTELPRLRAPRAFANWLLTIATSVIARNVRTESKYVRLSEPDEALGTEPASGPAEKLSADEMRGRLALEIEKLPPHYRVALALKYLNGYSVEDIASRLQVPEGTVRARLSRAYGILRSRLEPVILGRPTVGSVADETDASGGGTDAVVE